MLHFPFTTQLSSTGFMRIGVVDVVHIARFPGPIVLKYEAVTFNRLSFSAASKSL